MSDKADIGSAGMEQLGSDEQLKKGTAEICGRIHSFNSFGAADGPGLRYVVFMQGCPLRCVYCHNPDTWDTTEGTLYTVDEVMVRIRRFTPYYKNGGGVTVSGGEPLLQAAFVHALFSRLKDEGIHRTLDTSGMVGGAEVDMLISECSLILADVKFTDDDSVRRYCGGSLAMLRSFLDKAAAAGVPVITRTVIVPGMNDSTKDVKALAHFTSAYPKIIGRELLPFRRFCIEKYRSMGLPFRLENTPEPDIDTMTKLRALL